MAQIEVSKTSEVSFYSKAPIEDIYAVNKASEFVINTANYEVEVEIPSHGFSFKKPLMQDHFNENFMESDKYPKSYFKGKIQDSVDFSKEGNFKVKVMGKMTIHGVERDKTLEGTITIKGQEISIHSEFNIHLKDFNVKIPKIYTKNIAEDVLVMVNATLIPFVKEKK